jgi:hypothetical protein
VQPRWSSNGRELYYLSLRNEMMKVSVAAGSMWSSGPPEKLFDAGAYYLGGDGNPYMMYDVSKDGRFLMVKPVAGAASDTRGNLVVVLNWAEELKRLVP